ncbi:MAG: heavy-metal-associated domain-containing protein [Bacteroidota bacterium]
MNLLKILFIVLVAIQAISCESKKTDTTVSQSKTEVIKGITTSTFKVWGNCDMCKETIEGTLKVDGISTSDWSPETKIMKVSFDTTKISLNQIQKNIASAGYDNEKYNGDDKAYSELPECCQYERK